MVICQNVSAASYDNQDSLPFDADLLRALLGLPSRRGLQLCPVTIEHRNRSYAPGRRTSNCRIIGTRVSVCLHNDSGSLLPAQPRRVGGSGPGSHRPGSWLLRGIAILIPAGPLGDLPSQRLKLVPCPWAVVVPLLLQPLVLVNLALH